MEGGTVRYLELNTLDYLILPPTLALLGTLPKVLTFISLNLNPDLDLIFLSFLPSTSTGIITLIPYYYLSIR